MTGVVYRSPDCPAACRHNRVRRFRLNRDANNPHIGIEHRAHPMAEPLFGNGIGEEIELIVSGIAKMVVTEKITKAASIEAA